LRKLKTHSFLRTNPFDVENNLDGLEERFRVNHRDALADALSQRRSTLNESPSKWHPEILFLLLELSDQPTFKSRLSDLESLKKPGETIETWRWEDIAEEDGWDEDPALWKSIKYGTESDDDELSSMGSVDESHAPSFLSEPDEEAGLGKTAENLITQQGESALLSSVLDTQGWRASKPRTDSAGNVRKTGVSETQVAREVLFMLQGLETTLYDDHHMPVASFQMAHMMWETNKAVMTSFGEAGRQLSILRSFVQLPQKAPHMQVFQDSVAQRLKDFDDQVSRIQATFVAPQTSTVISLISIKAQVAAPLEPLLALASVIMHMNKMPGAATFSHLELLFEAATDAQLSGKDAIYMFLGRVFMESFKVYLRPVRAWMDEGRLIQGDQVFFVAEAAADVPLHDLWHKKFKLRTTSDGTPHVPSFLHPAVSKIMDAGKSIFVLKRLGLNAYYCSTTVNEEPSLDFDVLSSPEFTLALFPDLFAMAFERWIQSKYRAMSTSLRDALFNRCGLWSALDIVQYLYFMSEGFAASAFCEDLFASLDSLVPRWHDRYALTAPSHEAWGALLDTNRLSVDVTKKGKAVPVASARDSIRAALPHVQIIYRFAWPIQMILSPSSMTQYQDVFTLLLQFKRATHMLHKHKLSSPASNADEDWSNEALYYLCRARLLWFCTTVQTYLTTLVLTPNVLQLRLQLEAAQDVDSIIAVHDAFVKQVVDEACLGTRLTPIREGMLDVLELAIKLEKCHSNVLHSDTLRGIKTDFDRHLRFIFEGLRSVARASSDISAAKWDTLAEMLQSGVS
jgi:gamma-tubulin complex component 5